ncbi:MAG: S9 family peptidase [Planctomycetota bacterium]|nr:MAG: S9 family peptidase [Planctomycetota bacterium]
MKSIRALVSVVVLACAVSAVAQVPFSATDIARLRYVTSAEISPNGEYIAYLLSAPRRPFVDDNGPSWVELHVVDMKGFSRPYVTGEVSVSSIAWKPDNSGISFLQKREGDEHRSLYVIPLAGGEAQKVLEHDTDIADYSWSPDGKKVAFTATDKPPADEKELKDQGFNQEVYEEDLEMAHVWVAEPRKPDRWDDSDAPKPERFEVKGHASGVQYSPTGEHLAVSVAPTPLIDDAYMKRKLHVIKASDGSKVGLIENPGKLGEYRWSPDGEHLALLAAEHINDPNAGRLMVAPYTGGKPQDLLPELNDGDATALAWHNSDLILYLADKGVTSGLGVVSREGEPVQMLVPFGKHAFSSMSVSKDGNRAAIVAHSPTHPLEVFTMERGDSEPRRLTTSNPWLNAVDLAPQEVVTYEARDGQKIEGLLIHPLNKEEGKRYPLVLVVHGGPEAHFQNGWITRYAEPGQLLAANGFAVFYPNYRGSTGRGVQFSMKGQSDYGGKEFDDLIDAIDYLDEEGLIDKDKVGVTGGSYGGFASAWCATKHTDRFAASVMFVGISDMVSKFGTTDIPNEMFLVHARKMPWDDWEFFKERSPITYAEQARTPILILHGKEDPRVHPSQSMELYRYLKTLGNVPVRLVFYPGEGHGNRKAAARMDYSMRLLRWMEHYLKGPGGDPPPPDLDYASVKPKDDKTDEEKEDADKKSHDSKSDESDAS